MFFKAFTRFLLAIGVAGAVSTAPAAAATMVTYTWTTTNPGMGSAPTASFDVPLASVLAGTINYFDITNIKMTYSGLTFNAYTQTSNGLDNAAYVNPLTGAFIFKGSNPQGPGLGVFGYQGALFSNDFLSITVGSTNSGSATVIKDQFNVVKNGAGVTGFTAGFWSTTLPPVTNPGGVPEPGTWAMMLLGFGTIGFAIRRRSYAAGAVRFA